MSSSPSSLPTPRQLLTSILNTISDIPPPPPPRTADVLGGRANPPPTNPLHQLDPVHRPLLATLHVLFPTLLLPALDLLDRGLVTRLETHYGVPIDTGMSVTDMADDDDNVGRRSRYGAQQAATPAAAATSSVYAIRSAQKPLRKTSYIVHTAPWNCSCAAFAFAAFRPAAATSHAAAATLGVWTDEGEAVVADDGDHDDDDDEWGFGGVSFDGVNEDEGAVPPCCKHLLACVLAERWAVLRGYVTVRRIEREELAGIVADT